MNTILNFLRLREYFGIRRTSNPMRFKLTMLLRLPQVSLVQLTTCTTPATGSGRLIAVGRSSTFGLRTQIASFHTVVSAA
jgi:hypothetical protein